MQGLLSKQGQRRDILEGEELIALFEKAISELSFEGNALQQQIQRQILQKLGNTYLLEEICSVIEARQITNLEAYQQTARAGRKFRLNTIHRRIIWHLYERFRDLVKASGKETWQMRHSRAAELVSECDDYHAFDAVFIDEAQDLDPSALRFLVQLCKSPQHLFVTADANQSIYSTGFNWSDVHKSLNFKGRTGILHTNYRSTKEIGEACHSYLSAEHLLDSEKLESLYVHEGPLPVLYMAPSDEQESLILEQLFRLACRHLHHPLGSCALLCPGEQIGKKLAQRLQQRGIEASFMSGRNLNLTQPGVKILTLPSSKGLEFPIVALAGFGESNYVRIPTEGTQEEIQEKLEQARRRLFVGMTRSMRALFMVIPSTTTSPLLQGFDNTYWNIREEKR
jgi:superfamily I DNA/RNA helicase